MAAVVVFLTIIGLVTVFSVQNSDPVTLSFFFWDFRASLAIVIFLTLLSGIAAGMVIVSFFRIKARPKQKNLP